MSKTALDYVNKGVRIIKIKLGKNGEEDVERVKKFAKRRDRQPYYALMQTRGGRTKML